VSHAGATLVCVVASGLLVRVLSDHVPAATRALNQVGTVLVGVLGLPWSPGTVAQMLLAIALAFVWGVTFGLANRR
jgi:hypothetical protein